MQLKRLNTGFADDQERWTFVGAPRWKEDDDGVIRPPFWSHPRFDKGPNDLPDIYAEELAREDYAVLTGQALGDTDITVDYRSCHGPERNAGIVFRAQDSFRLYVLEIIDCGRVGQEYELNLWLQDGSGFRRRLARGRAPHSVVSLHRLHEPSTTRQQWEETAPDWVTVRLEASMNFIRVSMDGNVVFDVRDHTYSTGCVGLVGRGPVLFRNLRVSGEPVEPKTPWTTHEGEIPRFFYPGGAQGQGFNAYPTVCHTQDGVTLVTWSHAPKLADPDAPKHVVLTRSDDEGRTWSPPVRIFGKEGHDCGCTSIFAHRDGSLSCLVSAIAADTAFWNEFAIPEAFVIRSVDKGATWSEPEPFTMAGRTPRDYQERHGRFSIYSPWMRLSDGTVYMFAYEAKNTPGAATWTHATNLYRTLMVRSSDDGRTWDEPAYVDKDNFDHYECMAAEVAPGKLVAFMRMLRAPYMWKTSSSDYGKTWTPVVQSDVFGECPFLLRHSSGALILFSRGHGSFIKMSFDNGESWSQEFRISPASAMVGWAEMADGRVLIVMHEGYRVPGCIRGQYLRVTPAGPVAADAQD